MNPNASAFCLMSAACAALLGTACSEELLAQVPVAHWTFNDGINNYNDIDVNDIQTGGGNSTATWAIPDGGGLAYTGGAIGGAAKLSGGANNFFNITSIPEIANTIATPDFPDFPVSGVGITISGWINPVGVGNFYQGLLMSYEVTDRTIADPNTDETGQLWGLGYEQSPVAPHIDSRVSTVGVDSAANDTAPGTWHHVAMVWGNVTTVDPIPPAHRVYVDGQLTGEIEDSGVLRFVSSGQWFLGFDPSTFNSSFIGLLDDFAVYDQALSTAQIQTIRTNGLSGIDASGNATAAVVPGDVNGNGSPGIEDFNIIRNNLGRSVAARNLGDLDGSRKVDLNDFQMWLEVAPGSAGSEALAAMLGTIPEPSAGLLIGQLLLWGALWSRRIRHLS